MGHKDSRPRKPLSNECIVLRKVFAQAIQLQPHHVCKLYKSDSLLMPHWQCYNVSGLHAGQCANGDRSCCHIQQAFLTSLGCPIFSPQQALPISFGCPCLHIQQAILISLG